MAITKMKRLKLIALSSDRDALLESLRHVGCVEVREPDEYLNDPDWSALLHRENADLAGAKSGLTELQHALDVLGQYAPVKTGLLTLRPEIKESDLLDSKARETALEKAAVINGHAKNIGQLNAREARVQSDQMSLTPWTACDIPLEVKGTRYTEVLLGTVPNTVAFDAMAGAVEEAAKAVNVRLLSSDRDLHYLEIIVHKNCRQDALDALRSYGFSFAQIKDLTGTAQENIRLLEQELKGIETERQKEIDAIAEFRGTQGELKAGLDRVSQVLAAESAKERLLTGGSIVYLDGWASVPEIPELEKALAKFECAYELTEPAEEDYPKVPVELRNGKLVRTLNMVTEMYALPAYGTIDPNPLIAPFFILFYGMMMADMGYGLIMMILSAVVIKKSKPNGATMKYMMPLMGLCGISTFIWGAVTGGFFGDFIPQLMKLINPESTFALPALFSPVDDALSVMVGSLALGLVQIFTGMGVSMYKKIKQGQTMDALCNEGAWFVVFICAGIAAVTQLIKPMIIVILVVLLLTQGYGKEGIIGKLVGIGGSLYNNLTGYFSDILSYSRLMALMLAGAVIAQVFNTLGSMTGFLPTFIIISLVGNALNFALNILGCYVHDMRLQCLEFFGRFYEDGGKPFRPLNINTQYVDVVKK